MARSDYEKARAAAEFIGRRTKLRPRVAVVLGSGLGAFAESLRTDCVLPFAAIPHFPRPGAKGHAGRLVIGRCEGVPVAVQQGRVHFYEGYSMQQVAFPVRVLAALGVRALVLTNAAGCLHPRFRPPALMLLRDHINFMGANPLAGPNEERWGPRFLDMSEAYPAALRALARKAARRLKIKLHEGTYAAVAGPNYETPAEVRALARLGADAVGMSTVPETLAARHMGLRVLGISCLTNLAAGRKRGQLSHEEVLAAGKRMERQFAALLEALIPALDKAAR